MGVLRCGVDVLFLDFQGFLWGNLLVHLSSKGLASWLYACWHPNYVQKTWWL